MPVLTDKTPTGVVPPRWGQTLGGGGGESHSSFPISTAQLGVWALLTTVTMLFAGLSSAYIVLRGVPAWQNIAIPPLVWVNTLILIASSVTIEVARRSVRQNRQPDVKLWLGLSGLLGLVFLAGQVIVWRQLVSAGVYLPSTLHSSFFYVLTGMHGIHLLGGILGLAFVLKKAVKGLLSAESHEALKLGALYWHFMDGVWIFLLMLLVFA